MGDLKKYINEEIENFFTLRPTISLLREVSPSGSTSQMKRMVNSLGGSVLKIKDLAKICSRLGVDYNIILSILQDAYNEGGDYEVIDLIKQMTGQDLYLYRSGMYSFQPLY